MGVPAGEAQVACRVPVHEVRLGQDEIADDRLTSIEPSTAMG
jgi:hypothetical protein